MKKIHHITISTFVKDGEDKKTPAETIAGFLPENFVDEGIKIKEEPIKINEGENMIILSSKIEKKRHTDLFMEILLDTLGKKQCILAANQHNRVDEKGYLFIRLDKNELEKGYGVLVEHGNCYHIKILIAAYPKTREKALEIAQHILTQDI